MFIQLGDEFINLANVKTVDFSTDTPRVRYRGEDRWFPLRIASDQKEALRAILESQSLKVEKKKPSKKETPEKDEE